MQIVEGIIKNILHFMPVFFGFAFFGPLFAQVMDRLEWHAPLELSTLAFGMIIGGSWGVLAFIRGSWIWARPS